MVHVRIVAASILWVAMASLGNAQQTGSLADSWDAIFLDGAKIGYFHTTTDQVEAGGHKILHSKQTAEMVLRRFGNVVPIASATDSFELADGRLYAIDSRIRMSKEIRHTKGRLGNDGKFHISVQSAGKTESHVIDWSSEVEGPFAHETYLKSGDIEPGTKRVSKVFLPELNQIVQRTLVAKDWEQVKLHDNSSEKLLAIEDAYDKIPQKNTFWIDEKGNIRKAQMNVGGMELSIYRVSQAEATGENDVASMVDIGQKTLIKPDQPIPNAHSRKSATYELIFTNPKSLQTIPAANYQQILKRDDASLVVKIQQQVPTTNAKPTQDADTEFTTSNGFIQSDDPQIVELAKTLTAGVTSPWAKVQTLEKWVRENMTNRDFSVAFADAKQVLQTRQGDCTEHAVLLAALCRAINVPARVAMGLVYLEHQGTFGYHMWTEVSFDNKWFAVDGTLGQGFVGAGHIKIADGSLKGSSAMETMIPILQVIGEMDIKVRSSE